MVSAQESHAVAQMLWGFVGVVVEEVQQAGEVVVVPVYLFGLLLLSAHLDPELFYLIIRPSPSTHYISSKKECDRAEAVVPALY